MAESGAGRMNGGGERRGKAGRRAGAGAEKPVGESHGQGRGGGGTRERDSEAGAEGARRPVVMGEETVGMRGACEEGGRGLEEPRRRSQS